MTGIYARPCSTPPWCPWTPASEIVYQTKTLAQYKASHIGSVEAPARQRITAAKAAFWSASSAGLRRLERDGALIPLTMLTLVCHVREERSRLAGVVAKVELGRSEKGPAKHADRPPTSFLLSFSSLVHHQAMAQSLAMARKVMSPTWFMLTSCGIAASRRAHAMKRKCGLAITKLQLSFIETNAKCLR